MSNMSAYRLDYLFQAAIDVRGSYPSKSYVSKDLQDGLLIWCWETVPCRIELVE